MKEANTNRGLWEYFKCPVKGCFVSCGVDKAADYLDSTKRQLHEYYYHLPLDKMRCHCCNPLALTMSHTEKNPGRLFFKCFSRRCPFFQWADRDPWGKNRTWLEADKFIPLFDGRLVKRTLEDVITETPLQRGVRQSIDRHMGPFEGNWHPEDLSPRSRANLDHLVYKDRMGEEPFQGQYSWDEFTPKERFYMEKRGLVPPNQSDLKDMIRDQVEWHMYK